MENIITLDQKEHVGDRAICFVSFHTICLGIDLFSLAKKKNLTNIVLMTMWSDKKHITLLWSCASPSAYERNVHRMTEQQSCLPAAQTQRGHWICSCAKFKSEEVVLSMQT